MTDSACAKQSSKIAKIQLEWCPPLLAALTCLTREHDTKRARLFELECEMSGRTFARTCCRAPLFALDATGAFDAQCDWGTGWSSLATRFAVAAPTKHEDRRLACPIEGRCARRTAPHLTYVLPAHAFPNGLGTTARRRDGLNGAALQFRPGGT
jgi:peptide methionine sulfoxide reductase MsrB